MLEHLRAELLKPKGFMFWRSLEPNQARVTVFLAGGTCPAYFRDGDRFGRLTQDRGSGDLRDGDSGLGMITDDSL